MPGFTTEDRPVELEVKRVVDDKYCYQQTQTQCRETTKEVEREICTYAYRQLVEKHTTITTQKTYEEKSETMKVTTCSPSEYGYHKKPYGHQDSGEHQYCREEYQTQAYRVPLVTEPLNGKIEVSVPEPVKECVTKKIELTEVVCEDVVAEKCIDLAKYQAETQIIQQTEVVLGEPNCNQVTLTLPTQACSKQQYGYGHH